MTGLELVAGRLAAYVWGKARRAAGRADAEPNHGLDVGMGRDELVSVKLGSDPTLAQLHVEAGRNVATASVSDRTRQRVQLASAEPADTDDATFAAGLSKLVAELRRAGTPTATTVIGDGVVITGEVGGDVTTGGR